MPKLTQILARRRSGNTFARFRIPCERPQLFQYGNVPSDVSYFSNSQSTYVIQSSYWLTVFPLRGASALFDLAQFISLFYVWFKTKLFGRTPREIREVSLEVIADLGPPLAHAAVCSGRNLPISTSLFTTVIIS